MRRASTCPLASDDHGCSFEHGRRVIAGDRRIIDCGDGDLHGRCLGDITRDLVLNARDAMPRGGTILVRARSGVREGCVTFEVTDTGVGIDKENLERIFDPFFTTRDEGTGMGLSIVEPGVTSSRSSPSSAAVAEAGHPEDTRCPSDCP